MHGSSKWKLKAPVGAVALAIACCFAGCQPSPPPSRSKSSVSPTVPPSLPIIADPAERHRTGAATPRQTLSADAFAALEHARLVDLTHPLDASTIYWPTEEDFRLEKEFAGVTERGYYYASNRFTAAEHGGTHLDAPIHFSERGQTVDQIPLERLAGPAAVIDVSRACAEDRDYQISIDDLRAWELAHQSSLDGRLVLIRTGFSRHWPDREKYLGTNLRGPAGVQALSFPGLDPQAASWLVNSRSIRAVGIDTASIDYGRSRDFQTHVTLFQHNVPALENVAHLEQLPANGAWVFALPMKIGGGSGGPTRIVALLSAEESPAPVDVGEH